jgi:CDP-diacylglycerol---serine O-phosphatidyltransferase
MRFFPRRVPINRRAKVFAVLPTLLTLGNAVCGFAAITYASRWTSVEPSNALLIASACIFLAMVFDALDGSAARWANRTSEFGAELDSLCDAVSFGVAPAFIMLQYCQNSVYPARLIWVLAALYMMCALLRLARFNVETDEDDDHSFFSGLPSPAAAGTVVSFPLMVFGWKFLDTPQTPSFVDKWIPYFVPATVEMLPIITLVVACLMVSQIRFPHLLNQLTRKKREARYVIFSVFALAMIFVLPQLAMPVLFTWYALSSPIRAGLARILRKPQHASLTVDKVAQNDPAS